MSAGTLSGLSIAAPPGFVEGTADRAADRDRPGIDRDRDGIDDLCDKFLEVCESAVDPLEIAASLEFDGMSDQLVHTRYGYPNVFAVAEEMFRRVPRRPVEPEPPADPWRTRPLMPVVHGLIYALPAVCFPAATGLLGGRGAIAVILVSLLSSWTAGQGLAYLGYRRLGLAGPAGARRVLRAGAGLGMAMLLIILDLTTVLSGARPTVLVFAIGQGGYMLGASVLMVLGAERFLLLALAPGVLGSTAFLVLGRSPGWQLPVWSALAATPVLALAFAVVACRGAESGEGTLFPLADLRGALPAAGFGLLAAALLAFPVLAPGSHQGALLGALPLSLSMGAAEWSLFAYRRRTQRLLRTNQPLRRFGRRARLALVAAATRYLASAIVLTAVVLSIAAATRLISPQWSVLPQLAAYLALGGAMFLALLLQTMGSRTMPLIACAAALAVELLARNSGVPAQLAASVGLLLVLGCYAVAVLGQAVRHAY